MTSSTYLQAALGIASVPIAVGMGWAVARAAANVNRDREGSPMRRIMYVENKSGGLNGEGRIGCVDLSKSGRTYVYRGRRLLKTKSGYKYNCVDEENGDHYWVSGPRKDGADKLYGGIVQIDEDARVEYWTRIRSQASLVESTEYRAGASTRTSGTTARNERRARGVGPSR